MAVTNQTASYVKKRAPGHILVDEEYVDEVKAVVTSSGFEQLPGLDFDEPDKAGLVALCWKDDSRDPADVVDRIRELSPDLYDMVAPDHTAGLVGDPKTGESGTSAEMGGPATKAEPADGGFPVRTEKHMAGNGVRVGVVDTGIRRHSWFDGSFLAGPESIDPLDEDRDRELDRQAGHGTFVTGLILRQAPAATVHVVRAFDMHGFVRVRSAANAIVELDQRGADIINLSFGGYTRKNRVPLAHRKAMSRVRDTTVIVAAAGNHNLDDPAPDDRIGRRFWPAAMKRVVAVAALDHVDDGPEVRLAPFSNYGPWVSVAAPGTQVLSTFVEFREFKGWARWSGTSFAAPIVAGRIAAAMTDSSGAVVRTAKESRQHVLEEGARAGEQRTFSADTTRTVPLILSPDPDPTT